jgi:GTP-binding protein EngB required for normal cell division
VDLDQLARDLSELSFVPGTENAPTDARRLARCRRLLDVKLRFELRRAPEASPVVVVAGGTNVGKSTVFNWLALEVVSRSSALARFTKAPAVYVHESERAALADGAFLPGYQKLVLERPEQLSGEDEGLRVFVRGHSRDDARGVVLVDSPDIDSTHERNRTVAQDLLDLADAVVFVATPEKYNDEVCVAYLREAARIQKRVVCVLNKSADPEVVRDFEHVVGQVFADAPGEASVLAVPYLPAPTPDAQGPWREKLRLEAAAPGKAGAAVRARALEGTRKRLAAELREVSGRLREELSSLDRLRSEADAAIGQATEAYRDFLLGLDFYELDRVFERVLDHFKIPIIDDVYGGMRKAAGMVSDAVARTITGRQEEDSKTLKLRERRERDRAKAKELYEVTRAAVAKLPEGMGGPLASVAAGWAPPPPSLDAVNGDVERFLLRADEDAERWIDGEVRYHVAFFKEHPYLKAGLRVMKGSLQIGFGLVSAYLTGGLLHGFHPIEGAVSGLVVERAMKLAVDNMGGFVHYQTLKSDYTRARADLFRSVLEASVRRPLLERLPKGPSPEALERVDEAARELARG